MSNVWTAFAILGGMAAVTAALADEAPRVVARVDFGKADPQQILSPEAAAAAMFTTDTNEVVDGDRSLKADSRGSAAEWNEFLHTKPGVFQSKEAYKVSFDYKVLAWVADAKFYLLFRQAGGGGTTGWTDWQGGPGATGHVETTFSTREAGDYTLILGIQNRGAIAINNIVIQTDPAHRPVIVELPTPQRTWQSSGRTKYYVDSRNGNDASDGRSPAYAWRTLARINAGTFGPGDHILLRGGSRWTGSLAPGGSGTPREPIVLTAYGKGPKPQVDAQGLYLATLYLSNVQGWEVRGLDIANRGHVPLPGLAGVQVSEMDFGPARHIVLQDLSVHDVTGSNVKAEGGGSGINCTCGGDKVKTCFDDLRIQTCHLVRTDRNGITLGGNWKRDASWYPSLHVVIRGNVLEDIGGDGIVPIGCDGALVEHNVLRGGRMRAQDYAAGIWPWGCDNTVVQYNEVSGMKGTNDGEGYDSDYDCRNTLIQYNFSHDNDGGFMLICDDGTQHLPWNAGNTGTVIRYNISVNDGLHTFNITGPCQNTRIYNNVFYIGKNINAVAGGNWGGAYAADTRFANNIFYTGSGVQAKFNFGGMTGVVFDHNAFRGDFQGRPNDPHAVLTDPALSAPGSVSVRGYAPRPSSPCLGAGAPIPDNGGRDFAGHMLPADVPPSIGAFQK